MTTYETSMTKDVFTAPPSSDFVNNPEPDPLVSMHLKVEPHNKTAERAYEFYVKITHCGWQVQWTEKLTLKVGCFHPDIIVTEDTSFAKEVSFNP